jgi:hypothetical protein
MVIDRTNSSINENGGGAAAHTGALPTTVERGTDAVTSQISSLKIDQQDGLLSPDKELRRQELLTRIKNSKQKVNVLSDTVSAEDMEELRALTREIYEAMDSSRLALLRLDAALDEHFSAEEAESLKKLTRHVMGYYLNTHQYHNAVHAISMTRETLHHLQLLGIDDRQMKRVMVIQGLYHDTGNGEHPVAADTGDGRKADEVQAVEIFMRDWAVMDALKNANQPIPAHLASLSDGDNPVTVSNSEKIVHTTERNLIGAVIASTVFRDRFAKAKKMGFDTKYIGHAVSHVRRKEYGEVRIGELEHMIELMDSTPAWVAKNADISGSLSDANVLLLNVLNRQEDIRRGLGNKKGVEAYHNGFIGLLGAMFYNGPENAAQIAAKQEGNPFYVPDAPNKEALAAYGKTRLLNEKKRFAELMQTHKPMFTALFVLMGELLGSKENQKSLLELPISEIALRLEKLSQDDERIQRANAIFTDETPPVSSLDFDLADYPLLRDPAFATKTIPELTPGDMNRLFAPFASVASNEQENSHIAAIRTIKPNTTVVQGSETDVEDAYVDVADRIAKEIWKMNTGLSDAQKQALRDAMHPPHAESIALNTAQKWNALRACGFTVDQIRDLSFTMILPIAVQQGRDTYMATALELSGIQKEIGTQLDPAFLHVLDIADLTPEVLTKETFKPGDVIIDQHIRPERVFVILKGEAIVQLPSGNKIPCTKGAILGEISALTGELPRANVLAGGTENIEVITFPSFELAKDYENESLRVRTLRLGNERMGMAPLKVLQ